MCECVVCKAMKLAESSWTATVKASKPVTKSAEVVSSVRAWWAK